MVRHEKYTQTCVGIYLEVVRQQRNLNIISVINYFSTALLIESYNSVDHTIGLHLLECLIVLITQTHHILNNTPSVLILKCS